MERPTTASQLLHRLILCLTISPVLTTIAFDFSLYPECMQNNITEPFVSLPTFATQFTVRVEAKGVNEDDGRILLVETESYCDKGGERGASISYRGGQKVYILHDFAAEDLHIITDIRCRKQPILDNACSPYAIFITSGAGRAEIDERCSINNGNLIYQGDKVGGQPLSIRELHVRRWTQCMYDGKKRRLTLNDYYFNADSMITPSGEANVPVRLTSRVLPLRNSPPEPTRGGLRLSTSTYDFTYYVPSVADMGVFLPPTGVFCANWSRQLKTMPIVPDLLTLTMLTTTEVGKEVHQLELDIDYKQGRVAFTSDTVNGTSYPPVYKRDYRRGTHIRSVQDYPTGLSFTQTWNHWLGFEEGQCVVNPIWNTTMDDKSGSTRMHLQHADTIFGFNRTGWIYIGPANFGAIPCDRFSRRDIDSKTNASTISEVYWGQDNATKTPVLIGLALYQRHGNGSTIETLRTTVSSYASYPLTIRSFEVSGCIKPPQPVNIAFSVRVKNFTEAKDRHTGFRETLLAGLTDVIRVSPLRFTDMTVSKAEGSDPNIARIWIPIFEWPNVTGRPYVVQKPAIEVAKDLEKLLSEKDLPLDLYFGDKLQQVTFLKDSVEFGTHIKEPKSKSAAASSGYSSGSMTGLAFAMIILGCVAGLAVGFMLWKRTAGISYFDMRRQRQMDF